MSARNAVPRAARELLRRAPRDLLRKRHQRDLYAAACDTGLGDAVFVPSFRLLYRRGRRHPLRRPIWPPAREAGNLARDCTADLRGRIPGRGGHSTGDVVKDLPPINVGDRRKRRIEASVTGIESEQIGEWGGEDAIHLALQPGVPNLVAHISFLDLV